MDAAPEGAPPQQAATPAAAASAPATAAYPWGLYLHVIVVSLIGGFGVMLWFVLYEWLNKLIWDGSYVTDHAWMFPVICLPFSLLVGLLVKYAKAPSNLDGSILDSLTGDVSHLKWRDLPATVATSLASLFSGAVLGPEGAIGNIASKIAALYCDLFRIPADRRPKLVFASVASGYNGLLENPVFAAVLGTEVAETKKEGLSTLPAASSAAASATRSSCCCTRPGSSTSCTCRRCRATPSGTPSSWCRWRSSGWCWPSSPAPS